MEGKIEAERASTVSQISALKRNMEEMQFNNDSQHVEISRLQKISTINEQNTKLEIVALESRNERMSSMLEAEMILRRQSEEKACKYDGCEPELIQLRREVMIICICISTYMYMYIKYDVPALFAISYVMLSDEIVLRYPLIHLLPPPPHIHNSPFF